MERKCKNSRTDPDHPKVFFDLLTVFSAVAGTMMIAAIAVVVMAMVVVMMVFVASAVVTVTMFLFVMMFMLVAGTMSVVAMFTHYLQSSSTWEMPVQRIAPTWASSKE